MNIDHSSNYEGSTMSSGKSERVRAKEEDENEALGRPGKRRMMTKGRHDDDGSEEEVADMANMNEHQRRLEINRIKARDRRKRQKAMVEDMQQQILHLTQENTELRRKNENVTKKYEELLLESKPEPDLTQQGPPLLLKTESLIPGIPYSLLQNQASQLVNPALASAYQHPLASRLILQGSSLASLPSGSFQRQVGLPQQQRSSSIESPLLSTSGVFLGHSLGNNALLSAASKLGSGTKAKDNNEAPPVPGRL